MNKRRIIIATTDIVTGGVGSYLMTMADGLKARDWDVHMLVTNNRGNLYNAMDKTVTCHDLSAIPLSRKKVLAAADLLNEILPDILLLNNCSLIHYCLPLLLSRIRPIAVLHSDDPRFYATATMFDRRIFRWIAPTNGVAKCCQSYLSDALWNRIRVVPHGVNTGIFYRDKKGEDDFSGKLCFIGYIAENKGADLLPDIMTRITAVYNDTHLIIIGYGPMVDQLKKRFNENNILSNCSFLGILSSIEIAGILRTADIFLLPTRIEGFGLSIVEAMMSGAVPIVTRLEGISDFIIDDGVTGVLVAPDDVIGFANAIIHLLTDKAKLKSMSKATQQAAVGRYSLRQMLDAYEKLFEEEDNREPLLCRGTVGWYKEIIEEVLKKGVDSRWIVNRLKELLKRSVSFF